MKEYISVTVSGNLHDAARYMNVVLRTEPTAQLVAAQHSGGNAVLIYSVEAPKTKQQKEPSGHHPACQCSDCD